MNNSTNIIYLPCVNITIVNIHPGFQTFFFCFTQIDHLFNLALCRSEFHFAPTTMGCPPFQSNANTCTIYTYLRPPYSHLQTHLHIISFVLHISHIDPDSSTHSHTQYSCCASCTLRPPDGILNKLAQRSSVSYQDPIEK